MAVSGVFSSWEMLAVKILPDGGCLQDVIMLGADLVSEGLQLPVGRGFQRPVQLLSHGIERFQELDRQEMSQKDADHEKDGAESKHYRKRPDEDAGDGACFRRRPEDGPVLQKKGIVEGVEVEGVGAPHGLAGPGPHSLPDLRAVEVVRQSGDIGPVVVKYGAVSGDPGDARIVVHQPLEGRAFRIGVDIRLSGIGGLENTGVGEQPGVDRQVVFDPVLEQAVVHQCEADGGGEDRDQGDQGQPQIDLLFHEIKYPTFRMVPI